jgi:hypothetical protein
MIMDKLRRFWWILTDRCEYCGGSLWDWDHRKSFCQNCKKEQ